ncbi:FAD-dependent oxidoreductase [Barrientosiimonas humi]|uniref:FAD-dependent oxidoreductase n=1 Tax=Barrientosiimonas humi TaxID=999931 RepID=UPI00370DDAF0
MTAAHRVVVVGHGMVAARFVDLLLTYADRTGTAVCATVLGDEPHEPYNRLMLSEVIAGRASLGGLALPRHDERVTVLTGVTGTVLHRARRRLTTDQGHEIPYDTVVLATGAAPAFPGPALTPGGGVRSLRTLDDCRDLLAVVSRRAHVTVVGGGLLGLELACGLRTRGAEVALVHLAPTVLERQLDTNAGHTAGQVVRDLGIALHTGTQVEQVHHRDGHVAGLTLADGTTLATDLVVVCAGVRPRAGIAAAAGLLVDRGVVVGDDLRSPSDATVAAIGDCAQPPEGWTGLLVPGWAQADRLARDLAGLPAAEAPTAGEVVKLKAVGLEVTTMGQAAPADPYADPALRVLTLHDPARRRHVQAVLREGRVVGASCVGAGRTAADLTQAFERETPVPADPAALLLPYPDHTPAAGADDPTRLPDATTVCRCNGVTKRDVVQAHLDGDRTVEQVAARTRATTGCGGCRGQVLGLLEWMSRSEPAADDTAPAERRSFHARNTAAQPEKHALPSVTSTEARGAVS